MPHRPQNRAQKPPKNPSYRLHAPSGRAVVRLSDGVGGRRDVYLGEYGSPESHAEYDRVIAEWKGNGRRLAPTPSAAGGLSVSELLLAYWQFVERYYVKNGEQTDQVARVKQALRPVRELYGHTPAAAFGPKALKAIRERWIAAGHARGYINALTGCVRRVWKWGVAEELVPPTTYQALAALDGLKKGRADVKEPEPIRPVPEADVEAVLPHLMPTVAAMVRLQLLTGMRPGEVILVRPCDVDRSGPVWVYRPESHKTEHHDAIRAVFIGPKGQEVLRPFLNGRAPDAYCFSPREATAQFRAKQRKERKTKVQPSQLCRQKAKPRKEPGDCYSVDTYGNAVERACDAAFSPPPPLAKRDDENRKEWKHRLTAEEKAALKAWRKAHRWHPNQLRHAKATEVRRRFGLEAAQVLLGHSRADVTQVYAERDHGLAAKVAAELG
jgi:integrase